VVLGPVNRFFARYAKRFFNTFGFDVVRLSNKPQTTWLGLRSQHFDTILDVGANTGQFARLATHWFPKAHLICFEPLPGPFLELQQWAESVNAQIDVHNLAIGAESGTVMMHQHSSSSPSSSLLASTDDQLERYPETREQCETPVELTTLDAAIKNNYGNLSGRTLVKMDVQGYEELVIAGATSVLSKAEACILEVIQDPMYEQQATFDSVYRKLTELGLRYAGNLDQQYAEDGRVVWLDAVFIR